VSKHLTGKLSDQANRVADNDSWASCILVLIQPFLPKNVAVYTFDWVGRIATIRRFQSPGRIFIPRLHD